MCDVSVCNFVIKFIFYFLEPKARNGDGYLSEPEKNYDSDFGESRLFQNLGGERSKNVSMRRS